MKHADVFREVTVRICGTLDLAGALEATFAYLAELLPIDEIRVNVLDTDLHAVKTIAIADRSGARSLLESPLVLPLPPDVESQLAGNELEDVRTVGRIEEDKATASIRDEYFRDFPESSLLIMRLVLDGKRQGVFLLRAEGMDRFTGEHRELMTRLNEPIAIAVNNAITHHELDRMRMTLADENRYLAEEMRAGRAEIIGATFGLAPVMELVQRVAPLESPVTLLGETGVGKELVADAIHRSSGRREGPFVKLNCGAIPPQLIDSELFGHEKGAFTGAVSQRKGRFERANEGTLFLDEIGDLPLEAQVRLLRVLQTKQFERVGGTTSLTSNVRIIAATHRNLDQLVEQGEFRDDLWYRLGVFPISIPPLRERRSDIPALVNHFLKHKSLEMGIHPPPALAPGAMDRLRNYPWPGNVRELENVVERELILNRTGTLTFDLTVSRGPVQPEEPAEKPGPLDETIARHIRRALQITGGKVGGSGGAAELLKVNPSTLRHRMRKLGISFGRG